MTGHGAKFGRKKEEAVTALLTYRTIDEAAKAIGVSTKTLMRWMKEPEFTATYTEAKRDAFGQAIARLHHLTGAAVSTLGKVMLDSATPPASKIRAADSILDHTTKAVEIEQIEARLAALEQAAGEQQKAMRAIGKRLESLERQLGLVPTGRPMLMVVNLAAKDLSEVVVNTYIRLLKEAGELHGGGFNLVDTTWIPEGINVEEAEKFFRENGLHPSPDWRQREPQAPSNATEAAGPLVRIKRMSASDDSGLPRRYGAMTQ